MSWPFGDLRPLTYGLIMADPPWSFDNFSAKGEAKNPKAHYACMDLRAIDALPVGQLAARDCVLWLWATNPMLPEALEVLRAWGFRYATGGHWVKRTRRGKLAFGTGYILRSAGEPFLIGTMGQPEFSRSVRSVIEGEAREHSRKPDEAYREAERLVKGGVWRADLFSRQRRPGWDSWGDQADKFERAA
jgi:N6-adenosine-specific RNA methylase IME4